MSSRKKENKIETAENVQTGQRIEKILKTRAWMRKIAEIIRDMVKGAVRNRRILIEDNKARSGTEAEIRRAEKVFPKNGRRPGSRMGKNRAVRMIANHRTRKKEIRRMGVDVRRIRRNTVIEKEIPIQKNVQTGRGIEMEAIVGDIGRTGIRK